LLSGWVLGRVAAFLFSTVFIFVQRVQTSGKRWVILYWRSEKRIILHADLLRRLFAFELDEHGILELSDDGKEVLEEALFLAASAEAWGRPGYRGPI
jgi:hypothetical protein